MSGAALAKLASAEDAQAGHDTNIVYDSQTVVHMDVTNTGAGSTRVSSNISGTAAMVVLNNYPVGISRPDGLLGRTTYTTSNCAGVAGASEAAAGGVGVLGTCNNQTGCGVFGHAQSSVPFTPPPSGTGVHGEGRERGISGRALHADGRGAVAQGMGAAAKAALFMGKPRVEGDLEVVKLVTMGALLETYTNVPASVIEGKRTYAVAGLQPAFEHVGQASLDNGWATVTLPPDFGRARAGQELPGLPDRVRQSWRAVRRAAQSPTIHGALAEGDGQRHVRLSGRGEPSGSEELSPKGPCGTTAGCGIIRFAGVFGPLRPA